MCTASVAKECYKHRPKPQLYVHTPSCIYLRCDRPGVSDTPTVLKPRQRTHRRILILLLREPQRHHEPLVNSSSAPELERSSFQRRCGSQARVEVVQLLLPSQETFAEKLECRTAFD